MELDEQREHHQGERQEVPKGDREVETDLLQQEKETEETGRKVKK